MKNFIVLYYAPAEAMAKMGEATEEQKMEGMKPWFSWKDRVGDHLVDFGAPFLPGKIAHTEGNWESSHKEVTGYSIIRAKDENEAKGLLNNHPHWSWTEGCSIELLETAGM